MPTKTSGQVPTFEKGLARCGFHDAWRTVIQRYPCRHFVPRRGKEIGGGRARMEGARSAFHLWRDFDLELA